MVMMPPMMAQALVKKLKKDFLVSSMDIWMGENSYLKYTPRGSRAGRVHTWGDAVSEGDALDVLSVDGGTVLECVRGVALQRGDGRGNDLHEVAVVVVVSVV